MGHQYEGEGWAVAYLSPNGTITKLKYLRNMPPDFEDYDENGVQITIYEVRTWMKIHAEAILGEPIFGRCAYWNFVTIEKEDEND